MIVRTSLGSRVPSVTGVASAPPAVAIFTQHPSAHSKCQHPHVAMATVVPGAPPVAAPHVAMPTVVPGAPPVAAARASVHPDTDDNCAQQVPAPVRAQEEMTPCQNGAQCWKWDCRFLHPPCPKGVNCKWHRCNCSHPPRV
jgi:hypothetical protein